MFSQERAPTSVAYAENQSMFLDSLVSDAAWRAKYAKDLDGNPIPFEIIEEGLRSTHPFKVFQLRAMLSVSYFEKALYELPDDKLTKDNVQKLADDIELQIQGGLSPRPLLSVPHLVSDEASCYYQGYTVSELKICLRVSRIVSHIYVYLLCPIISSSNKKLAEMSVHQTREFFKNKYGYIVDNPNVGPTLASAYWECGNSKPFLQIVQDLTGKELSGDAWVNEMKEDIEQLLKSEKKEYDGMIAKCKKEEEEESKADDGGGDDDNLDLQMTVKFVDGDHVIADSSKSGLLGACKEFEAFVAARTSAAASS